MHGDLRNGAGRDSTRGPTPEVLSGLGSNRARRKVPDAPESVPDGVATLSAAQAAEFYGVSRSLWWKLHAASQLPDPIRLGRRVLWLRSELDAWVRHGAPSRERWRAIRGGGAR